MTYQTVRPSGLPYRADALWPAMSEETIPLAPGFNGSGSWSDDSDATYVSTYVSDNEASTVLAVDFEPVAGLVDFTSFGFMIRAALLVPSDGNTVFHMFAIDGTDPLGLPFALADLIPRTAEPTPTTYASGDDWYTIFDHATIRSEGFRVATLTQFETDYNVLTEFWRIYEFGLRFDIDEVTPPPTTTPVTRLWPRDDALGNGSAPRIVPAPRGGRVVGGYN